MNGVTGYLFLKWNRKFIFLINTIFTLFSGDNSCCSFYIVLLAIVSIAVKLQAWGVALSKVQSSLCKPSYCTTRRWENSTALNEWCISAMQVNSFICETVFVRFGYLLVCTRVTFWTKRLLTSYIVNKRFWRRTADECALRQLLAAPGYPGQPRSVLHNFKDSPELFHCR